MHKPLLVAASLTVASTMIANATIVVFPAGSDEIWHQPFPSVDINAVWDFHMAAPVAATTVNWTVTFTPTVAFPASPVTVWVDAWHAVNPHPGELPAPMWSVPLTLPPVLGSAMAVAASLDHAVHPHPAPADFYLATAFVFPYNPVDFPMGNVPPTGNQLNINVRGYHVPEPGSYAMIAGLGLVGFAAFRRMRA